MEVREALCRHQKELEDALCIFNHPLKAFFTCNRLEIYGLTEKEEEALEVINFLKERYLWGFKNFYFRTNLEAVRHSLRLASGLNSQLLGEREIFEQLSLWINKESFPLSLRELWKKILIFSQRVRRQLTSLLKGDTGRFVKLK